MSDPTKKKPTDTDLGIVDDDDSLGIVDDDSPSFPDYSALPNEAGAPPPPPGTPIRVNPNYVQNSQPDAVAHMKDPIGAFGRSGAQGATARHGDELSSGLASLATATHDSDFDQWIERTASRLNPFESADDAARIANEQQASDIPKTYAAGSPYADMRENMRDDLRGDKADFKGEHWYNDPTVTGELAGGALLAAATGGAGEAGEGAAVADRLRRARNAGAAYGAASGLGGSESDDLGGQALDTAKGGAAGALIGPVAEVIPAAAGAAATGLRTVANKLAPIADSYRFAASGVYPQQMTALLKEKGPEYIQALGRYAERLKGDGRFSFMKPWGARSYQEAAQLSKEAASGRIGQNLASAEAEGVRVPTDPVADALDEQARSYGGALGTNPADKQASALMSEASRWRTKQPDPMGMGNEGIDPYSLEPAYPVPNEPMSLSPSDAMGMKQEYERLGGFVGDRIQTLPHGSTPEMYQDAATPVRGALYDAMDTSSVGPEFHGNMDEFGKANTILNSSNKRVMHDDANQMISLPSAIAASGGLETFGPAGLAAGGAMGLVKNLGKDVIGATGTRLAQFGAGGMSNAARAVQDVTEPLAMSEAQRAGEPEVQTVGGAASRAFDATGFGASPAYGQEQQMSAQPPNMSTRQDGTDDPVEGSYLSTLSPDDRATQYYILMHSDPNFRARQYARGQQQSQQTE